MTAINEDYVSYEVAKLLKEKGFDEPCIRHWDCDDNSLYGYNDIPISNSELQANEYNGFSAPSQSMAMKWLREVHGTFIAINNDDLDFNWQCYDLINRDSTLDPKILSSSYAGYETYEKAVEAALKFTLENLI